LSLAPSLARVENLFYFVNSGIRSSITSNMILFFCACTSSYFASISSNLDCIDAFNNNASFRQFLVDFCFRTFLMTDPTYVAIQKFVCLLFIFNMLSVVILALLQIWNIRTTDCCGIYLEPRAIASGKDEIKSRNRPWKKNPTYARKEGIEETDTKDTKQDRAQQYLLTAPSHSFLQLLQVLVLSTPNI
jgi:uncharacterized membrane protein